MKNALESLGKKWLLAISVFFGGLLLCEMVCRLAGYGTRADVHEDIANWQRDGQGEFFVYKAGATINMDGLRDYPHQVDNPEGRRRIVCLGDSVTYGYGIHPQYAYPFQLQMAFQQRNQNVEVFNVALPGWCIRQQLIAWQRIASKYKPNMVTVGVCLNDFAEMQNNLAEPPAWLVGAFNHSYLVRAMVNPAANEIAQIEEFIDHPEAARIQSAYDLYFSELAKLHRILTDAGVELRVFVFPFRFQYERANTHFGPQEEVARRCAESNIKYIDVLPFFKALGADAFIDHDHLNAEASVKFAHFLADQLEVPK